MDECQPALIGQAQGLRTGGVIGVAKQHHLGPTVGHGPHLHLRCGHRHHDHGPAAELLGPQGHPLGMVASAGGDHTPLQLRRAETRHFVVGPAQLEAEHRLQVFPLQQHGVPQPPRQVGGRVQRRFDRHVVDAGAQNPLQHLLIRRPGLPLVAGGGCAHGPAVIPSVCQQLDASPERLC